MCVQPWRCCCLTEDVTAENKVLVGDHLHGLATPLDVHRAHHISRTQHGMHPTSQHHRYVLCNRLVEQSCVNVNMCQGSGQVRVLAGSSSWVNNTSSKDNRR